MFLGRLVDIGAELFAITCTVVHAQAVVDDMPDRRPDVMAVSDLFCRQARRRVTGLFGDLWSNDEDQGYRLARQVLDGQHEWLEKGMVDRSKHRRRLGRSREPTPKRTPVTDVTTTIDDLPVVPCRQDRRTAPEWSGWIEASQKHIVVESDGVPKAACAAQAVYRLHR